MRVAGWGRHAGPEVSFTWDGTPMRGVEGEPLSAALLASGVRLMARSFKYHRPRGVLSAGSEEPNALVTVGRGARAIPNTRATMVELHQGLRAVSQNRWPSLRADAMAINDMLSPLLPAGFYYKTFMWPKAFWERLYEPVIRRAAGLGELKDGTDADAYEKAFAHCDLLVIGAGPAGLMAALTAGRAGASVILATEDTAPGGRLMAERIEVGGQGGASWAAEVADELASMDNVRIMARTTVTGVYDQGTFGAIERVAHHRADPGKAPLECFWRIHAPRAVMATGATERTVAFANNDRPGIMQAGAVRAYLNRWGVAPGQAVTVFGNSDDAHRTARDMLDAGVRVKALIDARRDVQVEIDCPVYTGGRVTGTSGRQGLSGITVEHQGGSRTIQTDCLGVSGGWNPTLALACHMNGRPRWRQDIAAFVPHDAMVPGMDAAGCANGSMSTHACLAEGARAGAAAAADLGYHGAAPDVPRAEDAPFEIAPLWVVEGKGRKWLDYQNDVHVKDVKMAAQEGYRSVEHMKRYTTQGMATDQGRNSNVTALAVLADATGRGIAGTGTTTFRPPYTPVAIAALGAGGQGDGFLPVRLTTSHAASVARGAVMIEAGLWMRPSYFPAPGEDHWRQSCDREVGLVRNAVGVCDVSTLGKIAVQGADAGAFLDLVYANGMSSLKPGRVRYGIMLRDDGFVMDDGTCARLDENRWLVTTTTAAAGQVMSHMEFCRQALCRGMDVRIASQTDHWAQFAVAGPLARDLLTGLLDEMPELSFMGCADVAISGTAGRLFRISFSGEMGYELAVPARHGAALWRILVAQAESMGGGPYGMEALNVLRIEKGFVTHAEIDGRVTAHDLGMHRMLSTKKDFIGRAAAHRPGLIEDRAQLVGLRTTGAAAPVTAGAHLFRKGAQTSQDASEGWISSACHSPTFDTSMALAFLRDGRARHGEVVDVRDHVRGTSTTALVGDPVAFDADGGRARG
ncbi:MAG: sarcosine oxidase subunit alpha family protein [Paracoccaceae bacterium]